MQMISRLALLFVCFGTGINQLHADADDPVPINRPSVPDDLIDDPHVREELGVNKFTAPSIKRIFDDLDQLAPLPADELVRELPKRMPLDRTDLALEIGFLISDGFMAVQGGHMAKIEPLAKDLQRYGRALGAGDRVNRHAASLLDNAHNNNLNALKEELTATQRDVETDLIHLRDVDLAHLISLGGWLRALEVSSHAVQTKYTEKRALKLYREDIADYYEGVIGSLDPRISEREDLKEMRGLLAELRKLMKLKDGQKPNKKTVESISEISRKLATLALTRKR